MLYNKPMRGGAREREREREREWGGEESKIMHHTYIHQLLLILIELKLNLTYQNISTI